MLAPEGQYYNYSGCGNTLNCNQPVVRQFVLDCLRYWVEEMHVDGFRFDLGSILTRAHSAWHKTEPLPPGAVDAGADASSSDSGGEGWRVAAAVVAAGAVAAADAAASSSESASESGSEGHAACLAAAPKSEGAVLGDDGLMTDGAGVPTGTPLSDPPLVEMISEDPVLRGTKLIAEAWDVDGLNQVGAFPHFGGRWSEWNGHFRDTGELRRAAGWIPSALEPPRGAALPHCRLWWRFGAAASSPTQGGSVS